MSVQEASSSGVFECWAFSFTTPAPFKELKTGNKALERDPFARLHCGASYKAAAIQLKAKEFLEAEKKIATFTPALFGRPRSASLTRSWVPKMVTGVGKGGFYVGGLGFCFI